MQGRVSAWVANSTKMWITAASPRWIKCALCANPPVAQTPHCWQEICAETLRFVTATLTFSSGFTSALIGVFLLDPLHHSSCFLSKLLSSPYSIFPFTSTPWQLPPLFPSLSSILTRSKKKKAHQGSRKKKKCPAGLPVHTIFTRKPWMSALKMWTKTRRAVHHELTDAGSHISTQAA